MVVLKTTDKTAQEYNAGHVLDGKFVTETSQSAYTAAGNQTYHYDWIKQRKLLAGLLIPILRRTILYVWQFKEEAKAAYDPEGK